MSYRVVKFPLEVYLRRKLSFKELEVIYKTIYCFFFLVLKQQDRIPFNFFLKQLLVTIFQVILLLLLLPSSQLRHHLIVF